MRKIESVQFEDLLGRQRLLSYEYFKNVEVSRLLDA
jgi:hypothetical protein